jgi:hypothetical protein
MGSDRTSTPHETDTSQDATVFMQRPVAVTRESAEAPLARGRPWWVGVAWVGAAGTVGAATLLGAATVLGLGWWHWPRVADPVQPISTAPDEPTQLAIRPSVAPKPPPPHPMGKTPAPSPQATEAKTVPDDPCDAISPRARLAMELAGATGSLTPDQLDAAQACVQQGTRQNQREAISRTLLAHHASGVSGGLCASFDDAMGYHLEELDRSDPELLYQWVLHLAHGRRHKGDHRAMLTWTSRGLAARTSWTLEGEDFVARVGALQRYRAVAAHTLWSQAEVAYAASSESEDRRAEEHWRGIAKEMTRAWIDHDLAAGNDVHMAQQLCWDVTTADVVTACRVDESALALNRVP